ncbi:MAG: coenzyme F420-0:L-glutamate ligase, partial [Nitrososphaerales archaeon]
MSSFQIIGLTGIPEISQRSDLAQHIVKASKKNGVGIQDGDIIVVTQKIVSKAEGRMVNVRSIKPSQFALRTSSLMEKDPKVVEVILSETKRIVRMVRGLVISQTKHGFVCANAGVDHSNAPKDVLILLPTNPDRSAKNLRSQIMKMTGSNVAVMITDTFGRPWREGQTGVAIGLSGLRPLEDYKGRKDDFGNDLKVTVIAIADEIASA